MGPIEGSKPKPALKAERKGIEPAKVETVAQSVAEPRPSKPEVTGSGFDLLRKKLVSVSGRFVAHKPQVSDRADLKELVSSARLAAQAGSVGSGFEPVDADVSAKPGAGKAAPLNTPQKAAAEALAKAPKVDPKDPYAQHITGVRAELKKQGLPTSAEGVRVFVIGEQDAAHGPSVVRTVAGQSTGLAPGADVQLSGRSTSVEGLMNADPRKAEFDKIHAKIKKGTASLDDLATQGVIGADANLSAMRVSISEARARLPKPPDGKATVVNMSWGESAHRLAEQLAQKVTNGPGGSKVMTAAIAQWEKETGSVFDPDVEEHKAGVTAVLRDQIADAIVTKMDSSPPSAAKLALEKEVAAARKDGIIPFNAAGNDNKMAGPTRGRNFAHDIKGIVTVGNVDIGKPKDKKDDKITWESADGQVEIAAPGERIPVGEQNGNSALVSGTSFSSPYLAGVAALMIKANPKITPDQIEKILLDKKNSTTVDQNRHTGGARLIDPAKAVAAAKRIK